MSVRDAYIVPDIKKVIYELLHDKIAASGRPWDSWKIIMSFPDVTVFDNWDNLFIYLLDPRIIQGEKIQQYGGGSQAIHTWRMDVGAWCTNEQGGSEELNLCYSTLFQFFNNSQTCHEQAFTVTLGDTTYTDTTLVDQGLYVESLGEMIPKVADQKEWRFESELILRR